MDSVGKIRSSDVLRNYEIASDKKENKVPDKVAQQVELIKRQFADSEDGIWQEFARLLAYANGTLPDDETAEEREHYFPSWSQEDFQKLVKSLAGVNKQWREDLGDMNKDLFRIDGVYEFTEEEKAQQRRDRQYNKLKGGSLYKRCRGKFPSIQDLAFLVECSGRYTRPIDKDMASGAKLNEEMRLGMYPDLKPEDFDQALNDLKADDRDLKTNDSLWQEKIDEAMEFLRERDGK